MTSSIHNEVCTINGPIRYDYPTIDPRSSIRNSGERSDENEVDMIMHKRRDSDIHGDMESIGLSQEQFGSSSGSGTFWPSSPDQIMPHYSSTPSHLHAVDVPSHLDFASTSQLGLEERERARGDRELPMVRQDLFYPSSSTSNMDANVDFSFLHRRPTSSCSQSIRQYIHSTTPSAVDPSEAVYTPQGTPMKHERSSTTSSQLHSTPTHRPAIRGQLSQQRQRKVTSSITNRHNRQASGSRSIRSSSGTPLRTTASIFANTKKLPLRLPRPPLCLISDPYANLCSHLKRHGMQVEAEEFASAEGITADFALRGWVQTSVGGSIGLLNQTNLFLEKHALTVKTQIEMARRSSSRSLPSQFSVFASHLDIEADENCLTPTHILAVHGSISPSDNKNKNNNDNKQEASVDQEKGILIPCHALMYALQCVSLPAFPTSSSRQEGEVERMIPVVSLRVPRPTEYPTLHRFIYTHDSSALLIELLPMKHIARHWDHLQSKKQEQASTSNVDGPNSATDALSHLPTQTLLGYAYKIHSAWANGVAIGLLEAKYWTTLDRAWSLVMASLSIKKARILDAETKAATIPLEHFKVAD